MTLKERIEALADTMLAENGCVLAPDCADDCPVCRWARDLRTLSVEVGAMEERERELRHWWPMLAEIIEQPELLREPHATAYARLREALEGK